MPVREGEQEKINEWRLDICMQLGFAVDHATILAERHDIELHQIIELVQVKGCPPEQAFRILL